MYLPRYLRTKIYKMVSNRNGKLTSAHRLVLATSGLQQADGDGGSYCWPAYKVQRWLRAEDPGFALTPYYFILDSYSHPLYRIPFSARKYLVIATLVHLLSVFLPLRDALVGLAAFRAPAEPTRSPLLSRRRRALCRLSSTAPLVSFLELSCAVSTTAPRDKSSF